MVFYGTGTWAQHVLQHYSVIAYNKTVYCWINNKYQSVSCIKGFPAANLLLTTCQNQNKLPIPQDEQRMPFKLAKHDMPKSIQQRQKINRGGNNTFKFPCGAKETKYLVKRAIPRECAVYIILSSSSRPAMISLTWSLTWFMSHRIQLSTVKSTFFNSTNIWPENGFQYLTDNHLEYFRNGFVLGGFVQVVPAALESTA